MSRNAWRARMSPRMKDLFKLAERQGWEVEVTKKSHIKIKNQNGLYVTVAARGGDLDQHYAKTVKRLKDYGLVVQ